MSIYREISTFRSSNPSSSIFCKSNIEISRSSTSNFNILFAKCCWKFNIWYSPWLLTLYCITLDLVLCALDFDISHRGIWPSVVPRRRKFDTKGHPGIGNFTFILVGLGIWAESARFNLVVHGPLYTIRYQIEAFKGKVIAFVFEWLK